MVENANTLQQLIEYYLLWKPASQPACPAYSRQLNPASQTKIFTDYKKKLCNSNLWCFFFLVLSISPHSSSIIIMTAWVDKLNDKVAASRFGRYFQLEGSGHRRERKGTRFSTEIRAGLTT
jgi:hypothetical protein